MLMFLVSLLFAIGLGAIGRPFKAAGAEATLIIPAWFAVEALPALLASYSTGFVPGDALACILLWMLGGLAATVATYAELRPKVFAR